MSRKKKIELIGICKICENDFIYNPKKKSGLYCSKQCSNSEPNRNRYYANKVKRTCLVCKKEFEIYEKESRRRVDRGLYCSVICRAKTQRKDKTYKRQLKLKLKVNRLRKCMVCQANYYSYNKKSRACSVKCAGELRTGANNHGWKGGKPKRKCVQCNKSFTAHSNLDIERGFAKFCNRRCHAIYSSKINKNKNVYSTAKGGRREDLNMYFRSSWEANYARYLNFQVKHGAIKEWHYEPKTFEFPVKRGSKFYTPDFLIINNNGSKEYHEIKGYMDAQSKTKLKRMKKYYPEVKLYVIAKKEYYAIARKIKGFIPNWEVDKKHAV